MIRTVQGDMKEDVAQGRGEFHAGTVTVGHGTVESDIVQRFDQRLGHRFDRARTRWRHAGRDIRHDDRGEINSNIAWTGAMVLLAVTLAGIVAAKATGFAEGIDFGG